MKPSTTQSARPISPFTPEFRAKPKPYRPAPRITAAEFEALSPEDRARFDRHEDVNVEFLDVCEQDARIITEILNSILDDAYLDAPDPKHGTMYEADDDGFRRKMIVCKNNKQLLSGELELHLWDDAVSFETDAYQATAEALAKHAAKCEQARVAVLAAGKARVQP